MTLDLSLLPDMVDAGVLEVLFDHSADNVMGVLAMAAILDDETAGSASLDPGACGYNRPCAHQYVGKYQSCMV